MTSSTSCNAWPASSRPHSSSPQDVQIGDERNPTRICATDHLVRGLGADEVIDYRAERFEDVVRDVDVVFDTVGGETLERSWAVLKPGGRLVTVAASGERTTDERIRAAYFIVESSRTQLAEIARLIDEGTLRPVVGAVFPLAEALQAYQHKPSHGKVVLRVADRAVRRSPAMVA